MKIDCTNKTISYSAFLIGITVSYLSYIGYLSRYNVKQVYLSEGINILFLNMYINLNS